MQFAEYREQWRQNKMQLTKKRTDENYYDVPGNYHTLHQRLKKYFANFSLTFFSAHENLLAK